MLIPLAIKTNRCMLYWSTL